MKAAYRITKAEHLQGHVLRLTYGDGYVQDVDFGPWFNSTRRTPAEKRYRTVDRFKRFKLHYDIALHWGDVLIGMSGEDIRNGMITGVEGSRAVAPPREAV